MTEKIILYSNNCPKCNVLKKKMNESGIVYELCSDIELMIEKSFMSAPMVEVDGKVMNFMEAIKWIGERGNE